MRIVSVNVMRYRVVPSKNFLYETLSHEIFLTQNIRGLQYMTVVLWSITAIYHRHNCIHGYKLFDVIPRATYTVTYHGLLNCM